MNGSLATNLKLNSLKEFRERLASSTFTNEEILILLCEAEALSKRVEDLEKENERLVDAGDTVAEIAWENHDDTVDIGRLRTVADDLRTGRQYDPMPDPVVMQTLLARVMQKLMVDGCVTKNDELFRDLSRYLNDTNII